MYNERSRIIYTCSKCTTKQKNIWKNQVNVNKVFNALGMVKKKYFRV